MDNGSRPLKLEAKLAAILADRESRSQRRRLTTFPPDSVDFSSNSYLSLSLIPEIRQAYVDFIAALPGSMPLFGSGGSRLLDGNTTLGEGLEKDIANFHGAQAGLLFNSGFDANAGLFACLPQPGDIVIYDELAHASMHDGMRASRAALTIPFKHNCVGPEEDAAASSNAMPDKSRRRALLSLSATLDRLVDEDDDTVSTSIRNGERNVFVAVEGVYSMDGDVAPLRDIVTCIEQHLPNGNGHLIVDEAHSTGLFGRQGRGLVCELELQDKVFARLHTFGKAMGASGAIVLCSSVTRQYLINYAKTLIYTTALPATSLASIKVTYAFLTSCEFEGLRMHLRGLMVYTHELLVAICARHKDSRNQAEGRRDVLLRVNGPAPRSPIIPLFSSQTRSLAAFCQQRGLVVRAIVAPTVPKGAERVRICLHAANTKAQVDRLCQAVDDWARMMPLRGPGGVPQHIPATTAGEPRQISTKSQLAKL